MSEFIKITFSEKNWSTYVNVDHLESFYAGTEGTFVLIGREWWKVKETVDEILKMLGTAQRSTFEGPDTDKIRAILDKTYNVFEMFTPEILKSTECAAARESLGQAIIHLNDALPRPTLDNAEE